MSGAEREDGGPRVWNRGDIETVMGFVGDPWADKVLKLLKYIEECEARAVKPSKAKPAKSPVSVAGGLARAAQLTPERRSEIASRAAKARWKPANHI